MCLTLSNIQLSVHQSRRMNRRIFFLVVMVLLVATPTPCQYSFTSWTADSGIPQNTVYSILQTRDGYLWFTTLDGLVRFDGVTFTIFNKSNTPGLNSNRFNSLLEDGNGNLWIGTDDGGLSRYDDGKFTTYTTEDGLPHNQVKALFSDNEGRLVVSMRGGLISWTGDRFTTYALPANLHAGWLTDKVYLQRSSGALWFNNQSGLQRYKDATLTTFTAANGLSHSRVTAFHEDRAGNLWIGTLDAGLGVFKDGRFTFYGLKNGLPHVHVTAIYEDTQGSLWVGTQAGLVRFKDNRFTIYTTAQGLSGDYITAIYEDREGNLWAGTNNQGINLVRRQMVTVYTKQHGLSDNNVYPVFQDRLGNIWIGADDGSLTRYREGSFTSAVAASGRPFDLTSALAEDRQGNIWIGKLGSIFLMKGGKLSRFDAGVPLGGVTVRAIHQDREGAMWFATSAGLLRHKDAIVTRYTTRDGLAGDDVQVLLEDRQGKLWVGTYGGLSLYEQGRFRSFTEAEGLPSNRVRSLYEDGDGVLWVGTYDGGLSRLKDGRFTNYTVSDGLFNNGVFAILEDSAGNLWMSSNRGLYRASRQQLNDFAERKIQQFTCIAYGRQDGLANIECNGGRQPAGWKTTDGKLWFPTQGGVAVVDTERISINRVPPPVAVETCLLDRQSVDFRQGIEIAPGKENLEIHYTGLSFTNPELVRFKYKLEGLDKDWIDVGTRRVAYYSHLPPGEYNFRVIVANSDGAWNTEGTGIKVVVIPPFWQTRWFLSLMVVAVAGAVLLIYQYRIRQLRQAHAAQEAFSRQLIRSQENERKRIASELHDSLGQNLLIIKNRALLGTLSSGQPQSSREQFDMINASAAQALEEVRQITYNLRPYHLDRLGLTNSIEEMIEKIAASTEIRFAVDIVPLDGLFSKEAEINLYRIVQECLNNIVKHSQATEAWVKMKSDDQAITIVVEDNGQGFTSDGQSSGGPGFGLTGLSERVRMLGGIHKIHSSAGQGTSITIKINLSAETQDNE
jgi:signal transduction histidine kinase/ligand-binding sensor domain-containing protein